ncbi:MAG: exodeoxyribonuclease VII large subunit [Rhodocyclaceae bacterium]
MSMIPSSPHSEPPSGAAVLPVSVLNRLARQAIEGALPLLWVSGEVSNLSYAASGHLYFSLKDETAQARCVMFRNRSQLLAFRLANGMHLEVRALATLYEPRGEFQLNVESIRRAGVGALYEAFERLKDRLAAEGLFAAERKRPVPRYPRSIGVVTSLAAAALRDVLATLSRRSPHVRVILYPTPVQGEDAARGLVDALAQAGARRECDVLILARGGGSIEDLQTFNDEAVARAIAGCALPVVTGIGHETDTTIADLVADERAATPTAAAERVSAGWLEARGALTATAARLDRAMRRVLERAMQRTDLAASRLLDPGERLRRLALAVDHLGQRMQAAWTGAVRERRHAIERMHLKLGRPDLSGQRARLAMIEHRLAAARAGELSRCRARMQALASQLVHLDPRAALRRGYAIVRAADGAIVRAAASLVPGDAIEIRFAVGRAGARVIRTDSSAAPESDGLAGPIVSE